MLKLAIRKAKLEARLSEYVEDWKVSADLFGDTGTNIYDFQPSNYVYFLDHVSCREKLVEGLQQLSPLADDALEVALEMTHRQFWIFKKAWDRMRADANEFSTPQKYGVLILPGLFLKGTLLAEIYEVPLGTALIQMIKLGVG